MTQWVVSVEGAQVPARAAILKCLQARLGLVAVPDNERSTEPLGLLLHRVRGVSRCHPRHHTLLCGPWLACQEDPALRGLHREVSHLLASRMLSCSPMRHLVMCLDSSPHEAFETLIEECDGRETTLQNLMDARARLHALSPTDVVTPFGDVQIVMLPCPCFAADNPAVLQKLVDAACEACERVLGTT